MPKRWVVGFWLGIFFISMPSPVWADLSRGSFIPCFQNYINNDATRQMTYYSIQPGDTLWTISMKYHVPLGSLLISNNLTENTILRIGQQIKIPTPGTAVHVISRGETIWDIARLYGVAVDSVRDLNQDKNPNLLKIGDELLIPENAKRMVALAPSRSKTTVIFAWPLTGPISSGYGWRKAGFHHGIDIVGDMGVPIKAAAGGTVSLVGYNSVYGNMVIIDHGNSLQTLYGHASKIYVRKGQRITQGQTVAAIGVSGNSTGPHLHFEIRVHGVATNPLKYLSN